MPLDTNLPRGRAALIVAHPGHELLLHGWMEAAQPLVSILSDGSGGAALPRIEASRELVSSLGCEMTDISGSLTDRQLYQTIMEGHTLPLTTLALHLASKLADAGVDYVVADAAEGYNPVHDLCRLLADLIVEQAGEIRGTPLGNFEYRVTGPRPPRGPADFELRLDDGALARKLAAARRYEAMKGEVDRALTREGKEPWRSEILRPRTPQHDFESVTAPPDYETYGRAQVEAGRYSQLLTYGEHFLPLAVALTRDVRTQRLTSV